MASRKEGGSPRRQAPDKLVVPRTFRIKVVVKRPKFRAVEHRLQNREAEKNVDNPDSIDLRPHRVPVQVQAKREVEERRGKVPMVNLAGSQEVERLLQLSTGNGSRSAERKRARGPHRHDYNKVRAL